MIDTAAVTNKENWTNVYFIITVASTVAMFMVNAISNSQVRGESLHEGLLGTKGALKRKKKNLRKNLNKKKGNCIKKIENIFLKNFCFES